MTRRRSQIACKGGLNLSSPDTEMPPGQVIHASNIEQGQLGGYRRIDGYERYDGRDLPSSVSYWKVTCSALTVAIPISAVVTIGTVTAVTTQAHSASDVFLYLSSPDTIPANTAVTYLGSTVSTTADPITSNYNTDAAHMASYDAAMTEWRNLIQAVPGSGDIRGVAMREGEVVAFRDTLSGTECEGFKATGTFSVEEKQVLYTDDPIGYQSPSIAISKGGNYAIIGASKDDVMATDAGAAQIFKRIGGVWVLEQIVYASDAQAQDYFGSSVAISPDGTTAIVGATLEDTMASAAGAAYVFTRSGTIWTEEDILYATTIDVNDFFGTSVALSEDGNTAAVGATYSEASGIAKGAVTVFTRSGTTWTEEDVLYDSGGSGTPLFGSSLAISADGDTLAIGAFNESSAATSAGAVYVFTRSGTTWTEEQKLTVSDAVDFDYFGSSVDVSSDGNTLVSGTTSGVGSAYVFTRSGTTWTETAILFAEDSANADRFGKSVSVSSDGDILAIGANGNTTNGSLAGAAYVFARSGTTWSQQQRVIPDEITTGDQFGVSIGVSSDGLIMLVGGTNNKNTYSYDIYRAWESITAQDYLEQQKLTPTYLETNDYFGQSVTIDNLGRNLAVGAPYYEDTALNAGAVQLYDRYGDTWAEVVKLLPPNTQEEALFGTSVSMNEAGDQLAIGAPETIVAGTDWTEKQILTASDIQSGDAFGKAVAVSEDGNTLIVGADFEDTGGSGAGAAYVFTRAGTTWAEQDILYASDAGADDWFGYRVGISADGNTAIVGAYGEDAGGSLAGAAYVFVRSGASWTQEQKLVATTPTAGDNFGISVALSPDGSTAIVGAEGYDGGGSNYGAAYIFSKTGATWTETQILTASSPTNSDGLGNAVALSSDGRTAAVTAKNGNTNTGSVYVFSLAVNSWAEQAELVASDAASGAQFGISLSLSSDGDTLLIGAFAAASGGTARGQAYVFTRSDTTWTERKILTASDAQDSDWFGIGSNISGDGTVAVVGAYGVDGAGSNRGAAYIFSGGGATWTEDRKIETSDTANSDQFGLAVSASLNGDVVAVSASQASTGGQVYTFSTQRKAKGTVEYYSRGALGWGHVETITTENDLDSEKFGQEVVMSDDGLTMAVGAPYKSKNGLSNAGFVYVYELDVTWQLRSTISLDVPATNSYFGFALDLSENGEVLIIGEYGAEVTATAGAGSVHVYRKDQGAWNVDQTITAPNYEANGNFGYDVALSQDGLVLAIGAPNEDALGTGDGRVYMYEIASGSTTLKQTILLEGTSAAGNDLAFGSSVDLNEDGTILVASQGSSSEDGMLNIFLRHNDYWTPVWRKTSSDASSDRFGWAAKISPNGDYIACGAPSTTTNTGQAFVFTKTGAALVAGGDYDFDNYNFIGPTQTKYLYGADGANYGFEYNGTLYRQIRTGMTTDTPTHVIAHKQHLFYSFGPSMQNSSLGDPHEWQVITGAAELGIGDDITGFSRLRGGELAIFGRNETDVLYGSSSLDWELAEFSSDTGAYEWSIQSIGFPMFLDDRGIATISTTQERGNFSRATISSLIEELVNELKLTITASTIIRDKNQYRVFFSNGLGIIVTINNESEVSLLPIKYDDTVVKTVSQEGTNGAEQVYFGSSSGYIYRMDSGISFDGSAINSTFRLPRNDLGEGRVEFSQYKKRFFKGEIYVKAEGYTSFDMTPDLDYEDTGNPTELATTYTITDPSGFWTDQGLSINKTSRVRADIKGVARSISLVFSSNSKLIYPYTINTVALDWSFRRKVN